MGLQSSWRPAERSGEKLARKFPGNNNTVSFTERQRSQRIAVSSRMLTGSLPLSGTWTRAYAVGKRFWPARSGFASFVLTAVLLLALLPADRPAAQEAVSPPDAQAIFSGAVPVNLTDLRAMQSELQGLSERVLPATVAVQVGPAQGSGVIISPDGYVLTAAHVIMRPGLRATLVLHDGRRVEAESLGVFRTVDAGMLKITTSPSDIGRQEWPHVPMGESDNLKPGQWCLATGHPGGVQSTGTPVVRMGRILSLNDDSAINTDCTLIGGDSGGPLFDMSGKVIGVHSRIGGSLTLNLHVPVQIYRDTWDRLAASEAWGYVPGNRPFIGVQGDANSEVARVAQVFRGTPAEKAGVRVGDVITKFGGKEVGNFESLRSLVESFEPGQAVGMELRRGNTRLRLDVVIGRERE